MSVRSILEAMLTLLKQQVASLVSGDHMAVRTSAEVYEQLLAQLETAEYDTQSEELKGLVDEIQNEKVKLQSLLCVEINRIEFFLRLLVGSGTVKPGGYPTNAKKQAGSRLLNRRT